MDIGRRGFADSADVYERGRPAYPDPLLDTLFERLGLGPGSRLLDLGAGTGKLTRQLARRGGAVAAVEPSPDMRRVLGTEEPRARVLDGSAEQIPLPDESVEAVFCGQAFHWFDGARAVPEIARVLVPAGGLALMWNVALDREPELQALMDEHRIQRLRPENRHDTLIWQRAFDEADLFEPLRTLEAEHVQHISADDYVAQIASRSYMATLPTEQRTRVLSEVKRIVGEREVTIHYRTDTWWTTKKGPG
jgi:SAM-dependent methyltransferase